METSLLNASGAQGSSILLPHYAVLSCSPSSSCCRGRGWMKALNMRGRKGSLKPLQAPETALHALTAGLGCSSSGRESHISSPTICLNPRLHFSLLERLGLAANIRCRHRFGKSPSLSCCLRHQDFDSSSSANTKKMSVLQQSPPWWSSSQNDTFKKTKKKKKRELLILHYLNKLKLQTNAITPTKICLLPTESPNSGSYTEARGTCWCTHKLFPASLTSSKLLQGARLLDQQHCPCVREKHLLFMPLSRLVLRSLFTQSSGTLCNENGEGFEPFASPQK